MSIGKESGQWRVLLGIFNDDSAKAVYGALECVSTWDTASGYKNLSQNALKETLIYLKKRVVTYFREQMTLQGCW